MDTPKRYHPALVTLHWFVVVVMLGAQVYFLKQAATHL